MALERDPCFDLFPIGTVATTLEITVAQLEELIVLNGYKPIFWINGIAYLSTAQAIALGNILARQREANNAKGLN